MVLTSLGAKQVYDVDLMDDPTSPEEFTRIRFESDVPITWIDYLSKYSEIEKSRGMRFLRAERDKLLSRSDWLMTVDNFQTLANISKDACKPFR